MTVELTEAQAPPGTLADLFTSTVALASDLGAAQVTETVGALRRHLSDATTRVAVLGGARTGRSTLCAQLTGVLPEGTYELVDTPPIDGPLDDLAAAVARAADCDIVVVTISAHAAMSRTETSFLRAEVLPGRLTEVLLILTFLDQVEDEADRVKRATRQQAERLDPRLTVLPGPGREPDEARLGAIGAAITGIGDDAVTKERQHQVAVRLAAELDVLDALADAAGAERSERAAALAAVGDQEKVWQGLQAALQRRQRRIRDRICGQIADEQDGILGVLSRDLADAPDPVAWWDAELPDRLGRLLLDVGGRLDATLARATGDGDEWLERELRTQLGIDNWTGDPQDKQLPAAPVTATPAPAEPADHRNKLVRHLLSALGPVLPKMLRAAKPFKGQAIVAELAEPAIDFGVGHLDRRALDAHRAELIRQLSPLVRRHLDAYQAAVAGALAGPESAERDRLDDRWRDWRAVQVAAAGPAGPDITGTADRARDLGRQLRLLDPTIKGTDA